MIQTRTEYLAAVAQAQAAAADYYDTDQERMTDAVYDSLIEQIAAAEAEHPDWADSGGLLTEVAGGVSHGGDVVHATPMLSMDKLTDGKPGEGYPALQAFVDGLGGPVVVEPKLDGNAIRGMYRAGRLVQVVTRGDGASGEDVTGQAQAITGLPQSCGIDADFEVRGEVYITVEQFVVGNANRVASGGPPFANARNAVSGTLRSTTRTYAVPMTFSAYDAIPANHTEFEALSDAGEPGSYSRRMAVLRAHGFGTATGLMADVPGVPTGDPIGAVAVLLAAREDLGYPIDGAVVKADLDVDRERIGVGSRAPRWAMAFKFAAQETTTVVEAIEETIGRTGRLALRARVRPTLVDGSIVTFASLHNVSWLQEQDIRVGDTVVVKKAGDVIPRVESPILQMRPADAVRWEAPENDPLGQPWDRSTLLWRSTSPELSVVGRITYAVSRDCLDIMGFSDAIATALVESERVNDIADIFTLTAEELSALPMGVTSTGGVRRLGAANAGKIVSEIEKAKLQPLNRVICALGLRKTGRTMSRRLAAKFPAMELLRAADVEALQTVDGIALGKAETVHDELAAMAPILDRLAALGVNMGEVPDPVEGEEVETRPLEGMNVVITGKLTGPLAALSRTEGQELIEANGGRAAGSVSKTTSLLVCGEPGSSKYEKAVALGVKILTPEEFAELLGIS